jgi:hypothetical protein
MREHSPYETQQDEKTVLEAARHPVCSKLAARSSQLTKKDASELLGRMQFRFERFQIVDGQTAPIYLQHPFRLEAGKITGNEFAHGANLRREFLVANWKINLHARARVLALLLRQTQQEGRETVSNGGKRKFFDDSNQSPEPRPNHAQDFECNLGMRHTERLKILLADEQQHRVVNRGRRRGIVPAIKHREFGNRTARPFQAQHLLPSVDGAFEDADVASLDHIHPGARRAFTKNDFARQVAPWKRTLRQEGQFAIRQP